MTEPLTLQKLQRAALEGSEKKGFWDDFLPRTTAVPLKLMLVVSELSEALEEFRKKDFRASRVYFKPENPNKPEGFGIELADAVIRIADLAEALGVDLTESIRMKMAYNESRPFMHGKNC